MGDASRASVADAPDLIELEPDGEVIRFDTGLGTTYERWALGRLLEDLQKRHNFRSVVEGPGDGMTGIAGINSLPLCLGGAQVDVLLDSKDRAAYARRVWGLHVPGSGFHVEGGWDEGQPLPFPESSVDLAWNFNVLNRLEEPLPVLKEMQRISRRYVLVLVPNRLNYAFWLHRLHHRVAGDPWDHGDVTRLRPAFWKGLFQKAGLRAIQTIWLDCPWWPDIVDFGQLISDLFPFLRSLARQARPHNRYAWSPAGLPYYRPEAYPEVHARMQRLGYFERMRWSVIKRRFAHHTGILGVKTSV